MGLRAADSDVIPAGFEASLRQTFAAQSSPPVEERHLARIAAACESLRATSGQPISAGLGTRRPRRAPARLRLAAVLAAALLAMPVAFAGLALAGVRLPEPVDSAFESVGVELPNQSGADDDEDRGGEPEPGRSEPTPAGGDRSTDSRNGDGGEAESARANARSRPGGRPARDSGEGTDRRPAHAQDGQTGAPAHSEQGGESVGTPPAHAQDGAGGPPPHSQGGASEQPKAEDPLTPPPAPVLPERKPAEPGPPARPGD